MFEVDFRKIKYKNGFYFTVTFMHGDADFYTTVKYYIKNKVVAKDFCEMLCEIKDTRSLPMNHLYWLNKEMAECFEDDLANKILDARLPDFIPEDVVQAVNFEVPFDFPEYNDYFAKLVDIDITCMMDDMPFDVKFN